MQAGLELVCHGRFAQRCLGGLDTGHSPPKTNDLNQGNLPVVYLINIAFGLVRCCVFSHLSSSRARQWATDDTKDVESSAVQLPELLGNQLRNPDAGDETAQAQAGDMAVLQVAAP